MDRLATADDTDREAALALYLTDRQMALGIVTSVRSELHELRADLSSSPAPHATDHRRVSHLLAMSRNHAGETQ